MTELSLSGDLNFGFYSKPYKHCFNVSFHDNDVINYPLEAVFSLNNLDQGDSSPDPVFQPGNITLTVKDDDGKLNSCNAYKVPQFLMSLV